MRTIGAARWRGTDQSAITRAMTDDTPDPRLPNGVPADDVTIDVAGLPLHVRVWGDRAKPPVLLQHGGKDHGRSWDWTVARLADRYCLIVPDLRGHGESGHATGGHYAEEAYLSDFAAVDAWVAERWDGPIALVGHSLGGGICLRYASAFPDRVASCVAMEGLGRSQKSYDEFVQTPLADRYAKSASKRLSLARSAPRHFADREDAVARMAGLHPQLRDDQSRHLALHALREDERGWRWKHDQMLAWTEPRATPPTEYLEAFAAITCPVLLMYGADSWASSPAQDGRMEAFQNARLVTYDGAGHWLHHDRFDAFIADVAAFLDETYRG